jgi:hypothetical protein
MSIPVRPLQSQRRDLAINAGALIREVTAPEGVERVSELFTLSHDLRELIDRLLDAGRVAYTVIPGKGSLIGLQTRDGFDWFFRCERAGHGVSGPHETASSFRVWRCPVCLETEAAQTWERILVSRLRHEASLAKRRSGAARCEMHQSER